MLTGLKTWTIPFVDSHVTGNSSVTLDTAASPSDIGSHSAAGRLRTPSRACPKSAPVLVGVGSEPRRDRHGGAITLHLEIHHVSWSERAHHRPELLPRRRSADCRRRR